MTDPCMRFTRVHRARAGDYATRVQRKFDVIPRKMPVCVGANKRERVISAEVSNAEEKEKCRMCETRRVKEEERRKESDKDGRGRKYSLFVTLISRDKPQRIRYLSLARQNCQIWRNNILKIALLGLKEVPRRREDDMCARKYR